MSIMDKPRAVEKFRKFYKSLRKNDWKIGTNLRVLELVYSNACNFKCKHCSTRAPLGENANALMSIDKVSSLADEADALGIFEWNMHGGELLTNAPILFELIKAIKPERFYVFLTSNGFLITRDIACRLAEAGVNRVSISIDSFNPEIHDEFRGVKGAYDRAIKALEYVQEAGMDPYMNITVGHFNAFSEDVENLLRYSKEHGYQTFINIAIPSGNWQGHMEVIIDDRDRERLIELRKKYGNLNRDLWNPFDKNKEGVLGCQTMSKLYVTPSGDVFPCSFLHIKIGNVYEESLKDIVDYGYSIKYFHDYREKCLAGEDAEFIKKYMIDKKMSVMEPLDAREVFGARDMVNGSEIC
ncbi:MAG: radical SAM protein [Selenomonadaceae bacterium]|nr:radical SAM protein [Selenomonadaceae bacterium]